MHARTIVGFQWGREENFLLISRCSGPKLQHKQFISELQLRDSSPDCPFRLHVHVLYFDLMSDIPVITFNKFIIFNLLYLLVIIGPAGFGRLLVRNENPILDTFN